MVTESCLLVASAQMYADEDEHWGIRIENVVLCKVGLVKGVQAPSPQQSNPQMQEVKLPNNFRDKGYLGFEHVTMVKCTFDWFCAPRLTVAGNRLPSRQSSSSQACYSHMRDNGSTIIMQKSSKSLNHFSPMTLAL